MRIRNLPPLPDLFIDTSFIVRYNIVGMRKNLTVIGNSLGVIIERPILDILGFSRETELEVTTDGKRLIIERVADDSRKNRIRSLTKKVISSHEKTFRKLAE